MNPVEHLLSTMNDEDTWPDRLRQAAEREPLLLQLGWLYRVRGSHETGAETVEAEDVDTEIAELESRLGLG